jgi:hypothetical protein
MTTCLRLGDIDYGNFLQHATKVQNVLFTLARYQSIWHDGISQLANSSHDGLKRRGNALLKKWLRKEYAQEENTFASHLARSKGLDTGSLKALTASFGFRDERTLRFQGAHNIDIK